MIMADIWGGASSNNYGTAGNWAVGGVPTAGHDVVLTSGALNDINAGLNQSAVAIATFTQDMGFTREVGSISSGVRSSLQLNCPVVTLGKPTPTGTPTGSGRIYLDFGAVATVCTVMNSRVQPTDSFQSPIHLLGSSLTLNALGGVTGVALLPGETATLTVLKVDEGTVLLGAGVTPTAINIINGTVTSWSTITAPSVLVGGTYIFNGAAAHTALTVYKGATAKYNGTGTISTLALVGTIDFSEGIGAVTITNCTRYPGGKIIDPNGRVTFTNNVQDAGGANLTDNNSNFGPNRQWKVS